MNAMAAALAALLTSAVLGAATRPQPATPKSAPTAPSAPTAQTAGAPVAARTPVLIELFTSEGCSSCPPADDLLAWLVDQQPMPGVEIVALGFHVDYWDRLGWRDRFSSPAWTTRQDVYSRAMRTDKIYTPQMIVDGTHEFIGNDPKLAERFIGQAASTVKLPIAVHVQPPNPAEPERVPLTIEVRAPADAALKGDVLVIVSEDGLITDVQRGENAKKRLTHIAVVRSVDKVGKLVPGETFTATRAVSVDRKWQRERVKVVVLVQQAKTGRVLGLATSRLQAIRQS